MPVCFGSMMMVNIEMLMRELGRAFGDPANYPEPEKPAMAGAE